MVFDFDKIEQDSGMHVRKVQCSCFVFGQECGITIILGSKSFCFIIWFLISILLNVRFLHLLHQDVLPLLLLIGRIYILNFCICMYVHAYIHTYAPPFGIAFWFIMFTLNLLVLESELAWELRSRHYALKLILILLASNPTPNLAILFFRLPLGLVPNCQYLSVKGWI